MGYPIDMMYNQINIDVNKLLRLGFSQQEINALQYVYSNGGKFTPNMLQQYGYTYEQAKKLSYMYAICSGRVSVETKEETIKHLRKMFGSEYRISMQDLAVSRLTNVPRFALVDGITDEPYNIWNSKNYQGPNMLYKVADVSGKNVIVETKRRPQLKYKQAKAIDGVFEIKGVTSNNNVVISFNKKYCRLCNRFIIVASLKRPEFHHGMYEIMCFEGTRVYVYAMSIGTRDTVKYHMGTQRVYDFGLFPNDIPVKLENIARGMYNKLHGVGIQFDSATQKYQVLPREEKEQLDETEMVDF